MFNNISWASYWFALSVLLILYYVYVLLVYYRGELLRRFGAVSSLNRIQINTGDEELLPVVQSLTDEMSAYLEQAKGNGVAKPEVIFSLQRLVKKYAVIKDSPYQVDVNRMIQLECEDKCAVHLTEDEVRQVWLV